MKINIKKLYDTKGEQLKYTKIIKLDSSDGELFWIAPATDTTQALCFMEDECSVVKQDSDRVELEVMAGRANVSGQHYYFSLSKEEFELVNGG